MKLFYKKPMQLGADTGDTVADKKTEVTVDGAVDSSDGCDNCG